MKPEKNLSRKAAAALSYQQESMTAPIITAKGQGKMAEAIIEKAKEYQIPIQEDPSLVHLLTQLNINDRIPEELYQAVAEIFAFIYKTDKKAAETGNITIRENQNLHVELDKYSSNRKKNDE